MKRRVFSWIAATALGCMQIASVRAEEPAVLENHCETIGEGITDSMKVDLLDSAASHEKRQKALDAYMALAGERECPEYGYSVGLLYRFGADLPGNLLQKDTQKARELILRYAEDGNLFAYADLAEMALADGDAHEAMQWTQVYLALLTNSSSEFRSGSDFFKRSGYNGDLLLRAEKAWNKQRPRLSRELIRSDLAEYLRIHKEHVLERVADSGTNDAGYRASGGSHASGPLTSLPVRGKCEVDLRDIGGAYARYLIEVQPDGHVSRVTIIDFAPNPAVAIKLAQCVEMYEFKPFEGSTARIGIVPVVYGYKDGPRISK